MISVFKFRDDIVLAACLLSLALAAGAQLPKGGKPLPTKPAPKAAGPRSAPHPAGKSPDSRPGEGDPSVESAGALVPPRAARRGEPNARPENARSQAAQPGLQLQTGHHGPVRSVTFNPDGRLLATSSEDGTAKVWSAENGSLLRTFDAPHLGVVFSADGTALIAGGPHSVRIWDLQSGMLRQEWDAAATSRRLLLSPDGKRLFAGNEDGTVCRYEFPSGRLVYKLDARLAWPLGLTNSLACSADGKLLAGISQGNTIRCWDVETGALKWTGGSQAGQVFCVAFSPDGALVASTGADKSLRLWDARTGAFQKSFPIPNDHLFSVMFLPDGRRMAVSTGRLVYLVDVSTGEQRSLSGTAGDALGVSISSDGTKLGTGNVDNTACLWDLREGARKHVLGSWRGIACITVAPQGDLLASGSIAGEVQLWDLRSGMLVRAPPGHRGDVYSLAFSPSGTLLATAGGDRTVRIWDTRSGQSVRVLDAPIHSLAFSPDETSLAGAGDDGTLRIWSLDEASAPRTLVQGSAPRAPLGRRAYQAGRGLAYSPGGERLASIDGADLFIWDTRNWKRSHALRAGGTPMLGLAFSSDGKMLASGGDDKTLRLWNAETGAALRTIQSDGGEVTSVVFSPDGRRVFGGCTGSSIGCWEVETGALLSRILGATGQVWSVTSIPGTGLLASAGHDNAVRLWDSAHYRLLATLFPLDHVDTGKPSELPPGAYLALTPQGYYTTSPGADRYLSFGVSGMPFPAECFRSRYERPDLIEQALAGQAVPAPIPPRGPYPPRLTAQERPVDRLAGERLQLTVRMEDDSAVLRLACFLNGSRVPAQVQRLPTPAAPAASPAAGIGGDPYTERGTFRVTVTVPPDAATVKLALVAYDDDELQSPRQELLFSHTPVVNPAAGRLLGLCVGVSRYRTARLNLKFADQDAASLTQALTSQPGLYKGSAVRDLRNEQATAAGVKAALDTLVGQVTKRDTVVLFFSGHGWQAEDGSFYFATHETELGNLRGTALAWTEVVSRLAELSRKGKRVLVLLDACHSGSAASSDQLVRAVLAAEAGVTVLASSRGGEYSFEQQELRHGAFTAALLEALGGKAEMAGSGTLSLWELRGYVERRVRELTAERQHPQVPYLQDFDTGAPFLVAAKSAN